MTHEQLAYRVSEVCQILTLSRSKAWRMIASEQMPVLRFGRTVRVPKWWVAEQLARRVA